MSTKKERIPQGVRQEFDDIDYWDKLVKSDETVTLANGKEITVYEYMKQFMQEAYGNGFDRQNPNKNILKTDEQKKWAIRNNNNTNRDALNVSRKTKRLSHEDFLLEKGIEKSNELWEDTIKVGTYDDALDGLLAISCNELGIQVTEENKSSMYRFYLRLRKFLRYVRKDLKNARD